MHGAIFAELEKYVTTKLGTDAWAGLLDRAHVSTKSFDPLGAYPDADAVALVTTASEITGQPAAVILEDFGAFLAPDLIGMFWGSIDAGWKTLDLLEHTEGTIHSVVRIQNPGAEPPELRVRRLSEDAVEIVYGSARKMCALARGLARGVASHYGEEVQIDEPQCMHRGASECVIHVRRV